MELLRGEPKGPVPVFTIKEKGFLESLGRYATLREGPDSKKVQRLSVSSLDSPATMPDWKGMPRMPSGTFALKRGFCCSSRNFKEAFILGFSAIRIWEPLVLVLQVGLGL